MFVKEIMSDNVITVDGNETISDACSKYRDNKVGCLIVTEEGNLEGIVTERDVIERTICMDLDPKTTKIKEIMSTNIKTIHPLDKIEKALEVIKQNKIKSLPVVANKKLVGIVTITDIAYSRPGIKGFLELTKS